MRIAALGCSHTCGYHIADMPADDNTPLNFETWPFSGRWNDNNWAEFYINSKGADGVIFANPSNGWWEYSEWLSFLFRKYDDIKEVVIQNTYWNRFRVTWVEPPDYENVIQYEDLFFKETTKGNIDCWSKHIALNERNLSLFRAFDMPLQVHAVNKKKKPELEIEMKPAFHWKTPDLRDTPYMQVKTWMEIMSLKNQRDWFKEIYILQTLCKEYGAELKLFGLNKWTWIPPMMNDFYNFDSIQVAPDSVEDWFLQNKQVDILKHTKDGEHFDEEIHQQIALEYLPSQFNPLKGE